MTYAEAELTGQLTPREGEPTPRQVRQAIRLLHKQGYDYTYKEAWGLVRATMRQEEDAEMKAKVFALLRQIFGPSPVEELWDAKSEIEHAIARYRG